MDFNSQQEGNTEPQTDKEISNESSTNESLSSDPANEAKELLALYESIPNGMNFEKTKALALDCIGDILEHWLPEGKQQGRQYSPLNPTRNDSKPGSFTINTETGQWADFATEDKGGDLVGLIAYIQPGISQTDAAVQILRFIAGLNVDVHCGSIQRIPRKTKSAEPKKSIVMPIPEEAARTRPIFFGAKLGHPASSWEYRNAGGQVMFYMHRFQTETGKTYLPQTYWKDATGHGQWQLKAPSFPRPAYGLDRLAAHHDAPVLFTEGEKAADAAQRLFPGFVAVTTMNGSQSPEKTDFSQFAGRTIYIAPDNDDAGMRYKDRLVELLSEAGAFPHAVMKLDLLVRNSQPLEKGYDLADAEAAGWTAESLAALGDALWEPIVSVDPSPSSSREASPVPPMSKAEKASTRKPKKQTTLEFTEEFVTTRHGGDMAYFNNQVIAYAEGYWPALDPNVDVKKPLLEALGPKASAGDVSAIYELIKIRYAAKPEWFERTSPLICLNNGTLNPASGELLSHSVGHNLTNKLDIIHDGNAQCPLWLQTLDEIFAPDSDKAQKVQLLQEFIGYCLIPDTRFHKFLWLVGAGGNGKSLILSVLTALVGKANISYAQIERLQEKFVRAELQGKLVNISSEMGAQATVSDGYLKQITAGDIIEAERKFERPFSFKPYARLIGATNVLPRLLDHSDGFFRRAMILRFNRQFTEAERDSQRETRLMAELPGILNWAVAGLQALLNRGNFEMPESSLVEVSQYRVNSDPVRQFAEEYLIPDPAADSGIPSGELYEQYKGWSLDNGYKTLASNQFSERLSAVGMARIRTSAGRFWKARYAPGILANLPPGSFACR